MKIRRINGIDNSSNMIKGEYYEGKTKRIISGKCVWIDQGDILFKTGIVLKVKQNIFRTQKALYEVIY